MVKSTIVDERCEVEVEGMLSSSGRFPTPRAHSISSSQRPTRHHTHTTTTMPTQLQLSQTAVPFPFGVLAASTFVNSQEDITDKVEITWERDGPLKFAGKDATEAEILASLGKSLKGQQVSHDQPEGTPIGLAVRARRAGGRETSGRLSSTGPSPELTRTVC